jgi:hypothetical protein
MGTAIPKTSRATLPSGIRIWHIVFAPKWTNRSSTYHHTFNWLWLCDALIVWQVRREFLVG